MSERLTRYLATHLPELGAAKFTDEAGKEREALAAGGLKVLLVLCQGANRNDRVWWGHVRISEEVGLAPRSVKRLLAGFEQLGWLERVGEMPQEGRGGRPTVIYRVMLEHLGYDDDAPKTAGDNAPKTSDDDDDNATKTTRNAQESDLLVPTWAPIEPEKSKRDNGSREIEKRQNRNPKPETLSAQPSATDPGVAGGELVAHRFEAAVDMAVGMEAKRYLERNPDNPPGQWLRARWRRLLTPLVVRVLEARDDPNCADADIPTVARLAHDAYLADKLYLKHPPAVGRGSATRGLPGCPECGGTGTLEGEPTRTGPGVSLPCPCRARAAG